MEKNMVMQIVNAREIGLAILTGIILLHQITFAEETAIVSGHPEYAPFMWQEPLNLVTFDYYPAMYKVKGNLKECAVEIVKEAFKRMGQEITIRMVPMKRGQYMLKKGRADGMFTLYKTPERETFAYYPELPVLSRGISFYVRKDRNSVPYKVGYDSPFEKNAI